MKDRKLKSELMEYEESLKVFRDLDNVITTAELKGRAEGEMKKAKEIVTK